MSRLLPQVVGGSHLGWRTWESGGEDLKVQPWVCLAEGCKIFQALPKRCLCYPITHGFLSPAQWIQPVWIPRPVVFVLASTAHSCFRAEMPLFPPCPLPSHLTVPCFCDCHQVHLPPTPFPRHTCVDTHDPLSCAQYFRTLEQTVASLDSFLKILTPKMTVSEVELWGGDKERRRSPHK